MALLRPMSMSSRRLLLAVDDEESQKVGTYLNVV